MYAEERQQAIADADRPPRTHVRGRARRSLRRHHRNRATGSRTARTTRPRTPSPRRRSSLRRPDGHRTRHWLTGNTRGPTRRTASPPQRPHTCPPSGGSVALRRRHHDRQDGLGPAHRSELTIVTNSVPDRRPPRSADLRASLILIGGRVRGVTQAAVGRGRPTSSSRSCMSMSRSSAPTRSPSNTASARPTPTKPRSNAPSSAAPNHVVVVADSSKIGREHLFSFAPLAAVDVLVTDSDIDETRPEVNSPNTESRW